MSTFTMMLHYVFFFHAAAPFLPFPFCSCALSTFSTLLQLDYVHALIQEFSSGGGGGGGGGGGEGGRGGGVGGGGSRSNRQQSFDNVFFFSSPQLILQKSNS